MKEQALEQFEVGQKSLAEALYDVGVADGIEIQKALPVGEGLYTQEQLDAGKAEVVAEYETKLAEASAELVLAQETIAKVMSDDEADKAAIADGHAKLEAIKLILVPAPAPIEETVGTDAQP